MKMKSVVKVAQQEYEQLYAIVERKRKLLKSINKRVEELGADLAVIQEEYEQRVGTLQRKDRILEKEIHYYRQIRELLKKGLSYEDAVLEVKKQQEQEATAATEGEFDTYFDVDVDAKTAIERPLEDIRKIWKKLVQQFHPDLAGTTEERKQREDIMKKINNAYAARDYKTLQIIEEKGLMEKTTIDATEQLTLLLQDIENAIIRLEKEYKEMKISQWYYWRKKTKKEKEALFIELEREVLRDVLRKEVILDTLKKSTGEVA